MNRLRPTALVIDDEPDIRELLELTLGRMNIDMVWAEIAVAALAGSVFYGVVALIERASTFWHPSFRHVSTET